MKMKLTSLSKTILETVTEKGFMSQHDLFNKLKARNYELNQGTLHAAAKSLVRQKKLKLCKGQPIMYGTIIYVEGKYEPLPPTLNYKPYVKKMAAEKRKARPEPDILNINYFIRNPAFKF